MIQRDYLLATVFLSPVKKQLGDSSIKINYFLAFYLTLQNYNT